MAKVFLVDDDEIVRDVLSHLLTSNGHAVVTANNGLTVLSTISKELPDILITDLVMPEQEGIETIIQVRQAHPDLPIIAISSGGHNVVSNYLHLAQHLGANAILEKPVNHSHLLTLLTELT